MTLNHPDRHVLLDSLDIQLKLVKRPQRTVTVNGTDHPDNSRHHPPEKKSRLETDDGFDSYDIHGKSLKNQYLDASNINARIHLHELYSTNKKGWFPWILEQCPLKNDMSIFRNWSWRWLFWTTNEDKLPGHLSVTHRHFRRNAPRRQKKSHVMFR